MRLIFGASIDIDEKQAKKVVYVEVQTDLEEWKKLPDSVERYKEKSGQKNDTTWEKCTPVFEGRDVDALIERLIGVDERFEEVRDALDSLLDGIQESFEADAL